MMFSKVISTFGVLTLAFAAISVAQQTPINPIPRYTVIRPTTPVDIAAQQALAARGAAIQTWTGSFTYQGVKHPYTMVGTDPSKGSATTTLKMVIIPLAVKFSTQTFDPTKPIQPACGTGTAIKLTEESPIFSNKVTYKLGPTNVGTTQYEDAVQRAEFWATVNAKAPNYHVLLSYTVAAKQTLNAVSSGQVMRGSCGNFGVLDINVFDNAVHAIIAKLKLPPDVFPYISTYDIFQSEGGGCCVLGYHSVFNGIPYGTGSYGDVPFNCSGCGTHGFTDVVTISHEIGETINDPYGSNGVPVWKSAYAPQYGCNTALEVGDPLAGDPVPLKVPGLSHQFYVQDLALLPWFALTPNGKSTAVNHWYSVFNTFLKNVQSNEHSQCGL
jgi:hypothetical protein